MKKRISIESLCILESDVRRLEVELEFARERLRRCQEEIDAEAREAQTRAMQPTVRLRRRALTIPVFGGAAPEPIAQRSHPPPHRGATMAFGKMPDLPEPAPSSDEPSGIRAVATIDREAGRYE